MTEWQHLAIVNANPSPDNPGTLNDAIHRWQYGQLSIDDDDNDNNDNVNNNNDHDIEDDDDNKEEEDPMIVLENVRELTLLPEGEVPVADVAELDNYCKELIDDKEEEEEFTMKHTFFNLDQDSMKSCCTLISRQISKRNFVVKFV